MCGIAGIFHFARDRGPDIGTVERMRDTMVHRGPDGAGSWQSPDGRIVLGHRRLAIVDLSPAAAQPMGSADRAAWVTFNGEIYNHLELRRELQQAGEQFRTDHADTEVIVAGFRRWGIARLLERLAGDYGIALWDDRAGELHLIRDRIGVKPVYFAIFGGAIAFASEIKALLRHPEIRAEPEPAAIYHYLSFLTTPAPLTMFSGIFKLPAGCILSVAAGRQPVLRRYWDAHPGQGVDPREIDGMPDAELERYFVQGIRERLSKAVERRMMSDVPLGVFLSGGIDSSTNVALMSGLVNRPVDTFTVGYSDFEGLNELDEARAISRHFGTRHREVLISERDMVAYLEELIHTQDEPIADWTCIPLYFVSRLARESGVTVVQVGEGSDEQFCGYAGYLKHLRVHDWFWRPFRAAVPGMLQASIAAIAASVAHRWSPAMLAADIIDRAARDREVFWSGAHVFRDLAKREIAPPGAYRATPALAAAAAMGVVDSGYLEPDSFNVVKSILQRLDGQSPGCDQLRRMAFCELNLRLPELLLMRVDKICMSTTIEARVPFLDHELVEFSMDIPRRFKIRGHNAKYLLKQAVGNWIPREVIFRSKMGFDAPMGHWLLGEFGRHVEAELTGSRLLRDGFVTRSGVQRLFREHRNGRHNQSLPIWALFNLVAWHRYWIEGRAA
jgi:asparagine synthase (glutamine-hydrolysing)